MNKTEQIHYINGLLDNNPVNIILPITHKSNHGIPLAVWYEALTARGMNVKQINYQHRVYNPKLGSHSETKEGIFLFD